MELPRLPVTLARANGELVTLCTKPHKIRVDEPIALEQDPKVRPNPPPRPQKEEWVLLEQLLVGVLVGLVIATIAFFLVRWWNKRPKKAVEKVRPIPWVVALAELEALPYRATSSSQHRQRQRVLRIRGQRHQRRRPPRTPRYFDQLDAGWSTTCENHDRRDEVAAPPPRHAGRSHRTAARSRASSTRPAS